MAQWGTTTVLQYWGPTKIYVVEEQLQRWMIVAVDGISLKNIYISPSLKANFKQYEIA